MSNPMTAIVDARAMRRRDCPGSHYLPNSAKACGCAHPDYSPYFTIATVIVAGAAKPQVALFTALSSHH